MSHSRPSGHARVNTSSPRAFAACDACGFLYNLHDLQPQRQWQGTRIISLGTLVCKKCLDVPNPQLRSISLPPDPLPVFNARPEYYSIDEANWLVTDNGGFLITEAGSRLVTD